MENSNLVLSLKKVSKSFKKQKVLDDISFTVEKGEIFGIIGSSGSGKSTLLNIITGNLLPDKGEIEFEPKDLAGYNLLDQKSHLQSIHKNIIALKRTIGYSPQTPSFYDKLKCKENIDFFGSLYSLPKEILKINSKILLKLVGLEESKDKIAQELSGGMKKRLDLACALVHDPKILVLDEPTADLDFLLREQMWDLIKKIKKKGTTIVMSSHFIDEIEGLCDRIVILNDSKIGYLGSPEELKKRKQANVIIKVKTEERNYEKIKNQILKSYKDNKKIKIDNSFEDSIKIEIINPKDKEKEISKMVEVIKKTNQKILELNYYKEGISEMFKELTQKNKEGGKLK